MTTETEKQIVSLIQAARQAGSDAASFIGAQAPEVIQQMLAWETAKAAAAVALCTACALLLAWCGRKLQKGGDQYSMDMEISIVAYIVAIAFGLAVLTSAMRVAKIQFAPKLVVIEYVSDLIARK